jgi:tetratricopeptide (TPR) repeat protein
VSLWLPRRVAEHIGEFSGRAWLLEELLKWWDERAERFLLLTGDPGTGKSMVLAWLAGQGPLPSDPSMQTALLRLRAAAKAAHFCQASSRNITPRAFASSIAEQLTYRLDGFGDALAATLADRVNIVGTAITGVAEAGSRSSGVTINRLDLGALSDETTFDRCFAAPLEAFYSGNGREPMLLLVDALDEAQTYNGTTIAALLANSEDLPPEVRIIASTRDEPRVLKHFRHVRRLDLEHDDSTNAQDIGNYALGRLRRAGVPKAQGAVFARRLAKHSGGVYLYAAILLDELLVGSKALPRLDTYPLPRKLGGIYHDFLVRELGRDDALWFDVYEPLLGLVAVAQGAGLDTAQLMKIAGRDIRAALRACKQYLAGDLPSGPFRLFHKSFGDFLLESEDGASDFHIDATTWHGRIADHYLRIFSAVNERLDDYGLNSTCAHLVAAKRTTEAIGLIGPQWMALRSERAGSTFSQFQSDVELVWRAARSSPEVGIGALARLRAWAFGVVEQVAVYDDDDLGLLVALGRSKEAEAHARSRNSAEERATSLRRLVGNLRDDMAACSAIAFNARQAANSIVGSVARVEALGHLAQELVSSGTSMQEAILEDMQRVIDDMPESEERSMAQRALVETLGSAGRADAARALAQSIESEPHAAFSTKAAAVSMADAGRFEEARNLAEGLVAGSYTQIYVQRIRAKALAEIARAQSRLDHAAGAVAFEAAEAAARTVKDENDRNDALGDLCSVLLDLGDSAAATRIADTITDWRRDCAFVRIIDDLATSRRFEDARSMAVRIRDGVWRVRAAHAIAKGHAEAGQNLEARQLAARQPTEEARVHAVIAVASAMLDRGDVDAESVFDTAARRAAALDGKERKTALIHLARIALKRGNKDKATAAFAQALAARRVSRDSEQFARALRAVAAALASAGDPRSADAIDLARRSIANIDPIWRETEHRELATALAAAGHFDDARSVLEVCPGDLGQGPAWCQLAMRIAATGDHERASDAFGCALARAEQISNDSARDESLLEMADMLKSARDFDRLDEVAARIHRTNWRCEVLRKLAVGRHAMGGAGRAKALEDLALAEKLALKESSSYRIGESLAIVASGYAECGVPGETERLVHIIEEGGFRIRAQTALVRALNAANDPRGRAMLAEGMEIGAIDVSMETWVRTGRPKDSLWDDWTWTVDEYRAGAWVDMTGAAPADMAEEVFAMALDRSVAIPHPNPRSKTLLHLIEKSIALSRFDHAERALHELHDELERERGIAALVDAFIEAGQPDEALRVARLQSDDYGRRALTRKVAAALARSGRPQDALAAIDEQTLDGFIESAGRALAAWRNAPAGAVQEAVRALTQVAGWVRADWSEVHAALFAGPGPATDSLANPP